MRSKWIIVRRRLPDILALSRTYKPKNIRGQLVLLIAAMNKQSQQLRQLNWLNYNQELARLPSTVVIDHNGNNKSIYLEDIPSQQVIYVDVDGLSFSVPTRQLILAISRGDANLASVKDSPQPQDIINMLVNLSKKKIVDDGKHSRQVLLRLRIGKIIFSTLFIFIIGMLLVLMIGATNALFHLNSINSTNASLSLTSFFSDTEADDYW